MRAGTPSREDAHRLLQGHQPPGVLSDHRIHILPGYTFRPRKAVDKYDRVYVNFAPAVSREALRAMRQTIRGWRIQLKCDKELDDLSKMFNPVPRG